MSPREFSCKKCGCRLPAFPIYCRCGMHYTEPGVGTVRFDQVDAVECPLRGEPLGEWPCGCLGSWIIFACPIHQQCLVRQAPRQAGKPKWQGAVCNSCKDNPLAEELGLL